MRVRELIALRRQMMARGCRPEAPYRLSLTELAGVVGVDDANLRRQIGSVPYPRGFRSAKCDADGYRVLIDVDLAERIVRALGFDPIDVDWERPAGGLGTVKPDCALRVGRPG